MNYGAMYDAVNKNGTVRGVKYAMSNWFDIGDHTTQEGRYVVYDNTQTSEYELAVEGYLGKYKHSEDYYNKIWGKDVKINRENQLMVYLTKDREEEKKEELTEAERTLLKEVRETNYYEGFGVCEYMDMNLLAKFMDEEMNADGLSKSARVEGNTIYIECTVYDEFGQETKKSYTMDFSDCRDVFGSRYVSIDECTRMLYDFATVRYEEGWYTDIIVDDCLYSTIAKEQAEAYAREEIRQGVDEQQAREDYQQMVKELMITEDTTRMQLDTYMNERVRNVEVFNKAKDVVVAATDIAVLMICLSNPGSALAAAATIIDGGIGVLDGSVRVSQGEKGAGYFEIALSSLSLGGGIYDATKLYKANQTAVKVVKAADAADEELKIERKILETADEAKLDDAAKVKPKVVNETTATKVTEGGNASVNEKIIPPKQINRGTFDVEVPEAKFIGDSPVSGSHNATVKIIDVDGEVTKVWREVSGNATESERALGVGRMRQATHTEQRALTRVNLTDQTVLITGQNPPCKNCQFALRNATKDNNATIIYQWRKNGVEHKKIWKGNIKIYDI